MASFGLQWVPQVEQQIQPSEATVLERAELAHRIRLAGHQAAVEEATRISSQYALDYQRFQDAQHQMESWKTYMNSRLLGFTPKEAEAVQQAAFAWRNMDPDFYRYYESLSDNGKQLVEEYYQFLDVNEMYNTAEAELWNLNERSENIQKIADLWKFEAVNAVAYQKRIKQELREEKRKKAELRKAGKAYMAHVKLQKKQNRQRMIAAPMTWNTPLGRKDEMDSVLASLDKLAMTPTPSQSTKKKQPGFFQSWRTPKSVSPKDFLS